MDEQPGQEDGEGAGPDRDPAPPSPGPDSGPDPGPDPGSGPGGPGGPGPEAVPDPARPRRDPRLAGFAWDESREPPAPSARLALLVDELSGPQRRCPGADDGELVGLVRAAAAVESWAASAKLGMVREMMRREGAPSPGSDHGDLPETWSASLRYELAGALACSAQSADGTASLAWELQARLEGIGARLEDGTLTQAKARAVAETLGQLTDAAAADAEALIVDQLKGKTYAQVLRLAERAALTVDPDLAERRRERAQKNARVSLFREQAGTAGISGRDLPPDEALAAMAAVNARAEQYKESGAFGDTPMDVLRAYAYLDLIGGRPAAGRIAAAEPPDDGGRARPNQHPDQPDAGRPGAVPPDPRESADDIPADPDDCSCTDCDGSCLVGDYDLDLDDDEPDDGSDPDGDDGQDSGGPRSGGPGSSGPGSVSPGSSGADSGRPGSGGPSSGGPDSEGPGSGGADSGGPGSSGPGSSGPGSAGPAPRPGSPPAGQADKRRPADLVVPLATLLGLSERPGEIHGFGLLDPALAHQLAAAAAASPGTEICVTVTSAEGYALGHGCARPARTPPSPPARPAASPLAFPARLNLTIPAAALPCLSGAASRAGPGGPGGHRGPARHPGPGGRVGPGGRAGPWALAPGRRQAGTPGGFGTWTLTLPGGLQLTVRLDPVPTLSCDHRYESHGYQPSDKLRHLVQIRDGTCTFPPCNRHARESDFEHAVPHDQGGKTCACNAGARSRACHRVKQSKGWQVTQPRPGWHQWRTPSGWVYTQEPKRYPT